MVMVVVVMVVVDNDDLWLSDGRGGLDSHSSLWNGLSSLNNNSGLLRNWGRLDGDM